LDNHMKLVIEMMVHDVPAEQIKMWLNEILMSGSSDALSCTTLHWRQMKHVMRKLKMPVLRLRQTNIDVQIKSNQIPNK
jgi:hypothetical protein